MCEIFIFCAAEPPMEASSVPPTNANQRSYPGVLHDSDLITRYQSCWAYLSIFFFLYFPFPFSQWTVQNICFALWSIIEKAMNLAMLSHWCGEGLCMLKKRKVPELKIYKMLVSSPQHIKEITHKCICHRIYGISIIKMPGQKMAISSRNLCAAVL